MFLKTSTDNLRIDQNDKQSPHSPQSTKKDSERQEEKDPEALKLSIPLVPSLGCGFVSFPRKKHLARHKSPQW